MAKTFLLSQTNILLFNTNSDNLETGFGPFSGHAVNASWVAVQELAKIWKNGQVNLVIEEIPVVYGSVKKIIPNLWKQHTPVVSD